LHQSIAGVFHEFFSAEWWACPNLVRTSVVSLIEKVQREISESRIGWN
jgi:hypothetical protein